VGMGNDVSKKSKILSYVSECENLFEACILENFLMEKNW
jgi:hypothetical protein